MTFWNKIDTAKNIPAKYLLVTMNVKLYTNIPNSEGFSAVKEAYESYPEKSVATNVIITYLARILTCSTAKTTYKKVVGNGDSLCPKLCKHLWRFEQKYFYAFIKSKVDLYLGHIDETFFIWKSAEEKLKNFFNEINKKQPSIKFDEKYSKFIDVLIYKDEQQRPQRTLFKKNTDR